MGTAVIEIDSDDEMENSLAIKPPTDALDWASSLLLDDDLSGFGAGLDDSAVIQDLLSTLEGEKKSAAAADDDDDCVILDGDPDRALVVVKEEKKPGEKDGSEEELQVLGEKGECHCYVCDSPAPCPSWGKGTLPTDHCHATDKDGKWSKQRQLLKRKGLPPSKHENIKKMLLSSTTTPSSQQHTRHQVSVPQPFTPLGITVNQPSAGRVPVASNVIQNQQMHPSVRVAQNVVRAVHLPKASAPAPKATGKQSKKPAAAPTVYAAPNGYGLNRAVPNDVPWRPAPLGVLQTGQGAPGSHGMPGSNGLPGMNGAPGRNGLPGMNGAPGRNGLPGMNGAPVRNGLPGMNGAPGRNGLPGMNGAPGRNGQPGRNGVHGSYGAQGRDGAAGSNGAPGRPGQPGGTIMVIHGYPTQRSLAAPVQVRPRAHLRAALGTTLQALQYSARTAQGTLRAQDPSAIQKSWQAALANLASDLGVSDYNTNPPKVQQPVSTQPLQHSQLLSQAKASQGGETQRSNTPATAQMRPSSNGLRQLNPKSEESVVAMPKTQATQALCVLNSHSSLAPSETYLKSLVAKPAAKQ
ncbi:hypothetical protein ACQ4PT_006396 [Festuca glaucescens]